MGEDADPLRGTVGKAVDCRTALHSEEGESERAFSELEDEDFEDGQAGGGGGSSTAMRVGGGKVRATRTGAE